MSVYHSGILHRTCISGFATRCKAPDREGLETAIWEKISWNSLRAITGEYPKHPSSYRCDKVA